MLNREVRSQDALAMPYFDSAIMMRIFSYLRPEQLAQLMLLNREFNQELRDPSRWKDAIARHFISVFIVKKKLSKYKLA